MLPYFLPHRLSKKKHRIEISRCRDRPDDLPSLGTFGFVEMGKRALECLRPVFAGNAMDVGGEVGELGAAESGKTGKKNRGHVRNHGGAPARF
jgi:hypothetical protein